MVINDRVPLAEVASPNQEDRTGSRKKGRNTIAALDGVRAIAALLVVSIHVSDLGRVPWDVNKYPLATALAFFGRTGVDLFFVLSGFLLFMPYVRALLFQETWPSARKFYIRRIFRIWPGYYITLAAMILLFAQQYLHRSYWPRLALFVTFFMDSTPQTFQHLNGPFWTLAIEWQFYMLLPLITFIFLQIVKRVASSPQQRLKATLLCCVGLIILSLLVRGFGVLYQRHPGMNVLLPHSVVNVLIFFFFGIQGKYLEVFALGMIASTLYMFAQQHEVGRQLKMYLQRLSSWFWGSGILVLIFVALWQAQAETHRNATPNLAALNFLDPLKSSYAWLGEPLAGFGFALCVVAILFGPPALKWLFETRPLRWIGMISYGLYMWHVNLLITLNTWLSPYLKGWTGVIEKDIIFWSFIFLVVVPFSYLFYRVIERPGIRLGARLTHGKSEQFSTPSLS